MAETTTWTEAFRRLRRIPRANDVRWHYSSGKANNWTVHIGWLDRLGFIGPLASHPDPLFAFMGALTWAERECKMRCAKCDKRRGSCCPVNVCCECAPIAIGAAASVTED